MYEIVGRETLWEGGYLRGVLVTYRDYAGRLRRWETVERVRCEGIVAIVPVLEDARVILIRQFRPSVGSFVIEFPAGLNDKGESLETAARRELREETGYEAKDLLFLAEGPLSSGASSELLSVYLATGLVFRGVEGRDETEDIEVIETPLEGLAAELDRFSARGDLVDLKILGFIELAKVRNGGRLP